ncbi:MAG TPA: ABC transporter permease subunit [Bacteroidota bacterium]|jgi:ABC-type transport system involved in multi-copper enzyme maturation permease subunit
MIRLIIEKELREVIGSTKFAVTFGVCSLLIILSFLMGARNYRMWSRQYEAAKRENLRQLEGLTDWFSVQHNKIYLPPQPLAALVTGISSDIGRTVEVRGRGELTADDSRFNEVPIFAIFRFLDLDFIFQIVLSLFAILFAYDAINGEKERGTLRLSFANPIPRHTYILGKLGGACIGLGAPLLVPILIGCALLPVLGVPMSGGDWTKLSLILAAGLLYFGVFLSLSVMISSFTKRSAHSFLILLAVWILAVLITPRLAIILAGRAVEVPSVDEVASQKGRYSAQLWGEDRKKMAAYKPEAAGADPSVMMQRFNKFMQDIADERDKKMEEFNGRLNELRENCRRMQQRLALWIARLSPAATFSLAATSLAGTSLTLEHQYMDAATAYQKVLAQFMKNKTGMVAGGRMMIMRNAVEDGKKPEPINPNELPEFTYQPASLASVVGESLPDLALLCLFNILFFLGSYLGFMRYDVR